jgi:beta-glucosidase
MEDYPGQTFRYYTESPAYGFGFGLGYTAFEYHNLSLSASTISATDTLFVTVNVTNVGLTFTSDELVQVYVSYMNQTVGQGCQSFPLRELKAFQKLVAVLPRESRRVKLAVPASQLALVDVDCVLRVLSGQYQVHVGGRSPSIGVYQPTQPLLLATFQVHH